MSTVQKLATELAWRDRKEHGRREPARDPWCVSSLFKAGHITSTQHGAAVRLSTLIERGQGQGGTGRLEFVDGSSADPHARQMDQAMCLRAAENAMHSVRQALSGPDADRRRATLASAMEFPHVSTASACRAAGYGYGNHRSFIAGLVAALDILVIHFDACDDDRKNWVRGLVGCAESVDTRKAL